MLIEWQFAPGSLYVDEEAFALYWNDDLVTSTSILNDHLHIEFGATWQAFLEQGDMQAIYSKADTALQKSLLRRSKGKGKGKEKQENNTVFGIPMNDY